MGRAGRARRDGGIEPQLAALQPLQRAGIRCRTWLEHPSHAVPRAERRCLHPGRALEQRGRQPRCRGRRGRASRRGAGQRQGRYGAPRRRRRRLRPGQHVAGKCARLRPNAGGAQGRGADTRCHGVRHGLSGHQPRHATALQPRSCTRRVDRHPHRADRAGVHVRDARRNRRSARVRRDHDPNHPRRGVDRGPHARDGHVRDEHRLADRYRNRDRLFDARRVPLPRGARAPGRSPQRAGHHDGDGRPSHRVLGSHRRGGIGPARLHAAALHPLDGDRRPARPGRECARFRHAPAGPPLAAGPARQLVAHRAEVGAGAASRQRPRLLDAARSYDHATPDPGSGRLGRGDAGDRVPRPSAEADRWR